MTQFEVGSEITWSELYINHLPLDEGSLFRVCEYTGTIQHIARNSVYINITSYTCRGETFQVQVKNEEVDKVWLASYVTDEDLKWQIEETLPRNSDPYTIYGLRDPRDRLIHYVGVTIRPERRYKQHLLCQDTNNTQKKTWIRNLQEQGLQPELVPLEIVKGAKKGYQREDYWIHFYLSQGAPLTNMLEVTS